MTEYKQSPFLTAVLNLKKLFVNNYLLNLTLHVVMARIAFRRFMVLLSSPSLMSVWKRKFLYTNIDVLEVSEGCYVK